MTLFMHFSMRHSG